MDLWKETFHDSERYVKLVFDTYFDPENVFVHFNGDTLVAMMLCVPYQFKLETADGSHRSLRGAYLCGLATLPEYRRKGIMSQLMREAEEVMLSRGMDLMFLIPADDHLRAYYARMGYYNATMRLPQNIRFSHHSSFLSIFPLRPFLEQSSAFAISLAQACNHIDSIRRESTLIHQVRDMLAVFSENENVFLITENSFDPEYSDLSKVKAIVFPDRPVGCKGGKVSIPALYILQGDERDDMEDRADSRNDIIDRISEAYPDSEVTLLEASDSSENFALCEPYAMVKILPNERDYEISENQIFNISLMLD